MPALVYFVLLFFLDVVKPVLFVEEKLAATCAFDDVVLVVLLRVAYKLVVAFESGVAFLAFVPAKETHGMS